MNNSIPDEIREKTLHRPYNFKCLYSGTRKCIALKYFGNGVIEIKPFSHYDVNCPYLQQLTTMNFCSCPTYAYLFTGGRK